MHDISVEFDVPVPMSDGAVLRADVYRPAAEGVFPVLLSRHPYGKAFLANGFINTVEATRAGYIVVHQDSRGRFASEGQWIPFAFERSDGFDTIAWAAGLPGSNGRVGMFGGSYLGSTQWSAASTGASALKAIAPFVTWSDPADGLLFRGGAVEFGVNTVWGLMTALPQIQRDVESGEDSVDHLLSTMRNYDSLASQGYWQLPVAIPPVLEETGQPDLGVRRALADPATLNESSVRSWYDDVSVPSLGFAGWFDVFLQGAIDNYVGMRERGRTARLVIGPWDHNSSGSPFTAGRVGELSYGLSANAPGGKTLTELHTEWFDHWLADGPATEAHQSGVLLYVMGINQWRVEEDWPLARAVATPLHLRGSGDLTWDVPRDDTQSTFVYDPADPVLTRGGNLVMATEYPAGPFDQRDVESRDDVLVFTTAPLDRDIEISGRITATLFASTDGPSTDWVVRLCDVDEHGVSRNVADGIRRIATQANRIEEVVIDLWSTSIVITAGHCIRVQVTSSNFPRWDRNLNTGEDITTATAMRMAQQTVHFGPTHPTRVTLPIVG